jgi:hypothetical protein
VTAVGLLVAGVGERDPGLTVPVVGEPPAGAERCERDPGRAEVRGWASENLWSVQWW